jgi:hypothetical protein
MTRQPDQVADATTLSPSRPTRASDRSERYTSASTVTLL